MSSISITYPELLAAIKENGLSQITGKYYELQGGYQTDKAPLLSEIKSVIGACAIGQAAINLSKKYDTDITGDDITDATDSAFSDYVFRLNDEDGLDYEQIAERAKEEFAGCDWFDEGIIIHT
jgi:hypothetical protein